ncbi:MAG: hypothetical protein HXY43_18440 [Fischerella sp.]|uniref:hypothetical protein n=1 Tax=Fischerella sp. TaxID=1191 RepID=UPI0018292BC5|nr:hypothetical protein [Fischerella sp.]NWF61176.1 hypothetical protein [Fischerella sp.]
MVWLLFQRLSYSLSILCEKSFLRSRALQPWHRFIKKAIAAHELDVCKELRSH